MTIEEQRKEAAITNDLVMHLIHLIESDDSRYSFVYGSTDKIEIYDKEKDIDYVLNINKVNYDKNWDETIFNLFYNNQY